MDWSALIWGFLIGSIYGTAVSVYLQYRLELRWMKR